MMKTSVASLQTRPIPVEAGERLPMFFTDIPKESVAQQSEEETGDDEGEASEHQSSEEMVSAPEEVQHVDPSELLTPVAVDAQKEIKRAGLTKPALYIGKASSSIPPEVLAKKASAFKPTTKSKQKLW